MKKIIIGLIVITVGAFGVQAMMNTSNAKNTTSETQKAVINDAGVFNSTSREDALKRFAGKPTLVFMVGTFCPHCQTAMPTYKPEIWDVYKDSINIFANVTDGQGGKRFPVDAIPQGVDAKLDYKTLVGEECNYVPSWVLLDAEGVVKESSCGAGKDLTVMKASIDALLPAPEK